MRRTLLDELHSVIDLLIYGGVFESSHKHIGSLYKIDATGRLVFPAVDMVDQMCAKYTVQ
jgi:hypothetical protein